MPIHSMSSPRFSALAFRYPRALPDKEVYTFRNDFNAEAFQTMLTDHHDPKEIGVANASAPLNPGDVVLITGDRQMVMLQPNVKEVATLYYQMQGLSADGKTPIRASGGRFNDDVSYEEVLKTASELTTLHHNKWRPMLEPVLGRPGTERFIQACLRLYEDHIRGKRPPVLFVRSGRERTGREKGTGRIFHRRRGHK